VHEKIGMPNGSNHNRGKKAAAVKSTDQKVIKDADKIRILLVGAS